MMEESIFKSCLKRKVKFTASTFVKFLITGTVALSLTACGGGGGGGGSSSSGGNGGGNSSLEKPETHIKVEDKKFTTEENIDISSLNADSVIAILGTNSEIINNKKITVNDKESLVTTYNSAEAETVLDAFKKSGNSFAIFADGGSVTNAKEGVLEISGNKVHAITGLYAEITNNGTITTGTNKADEAVGIFSLGGNVTNNGDIILTSEDATGINVVNGAKLYYTDNDFIEIKNKGKIIVLNNKNIKVIGESPVGISGVGSDIEVINGENGNIIVDNVITKTLKGINTKGISIDTDDGNSKSHDITITNNGKITVNVSSKIENLTDELKNRYFNSYGIYAEADTTTINNNKDIELNVTAGVLQQTSAGIKTDGKNNIINNSGNITIISKGKDAQENYFALVGIKAEGDNTTITNKNINITAENKCTEIYGISLEGNNGSVTNNGDITISGKDTYSIKGIDVNGNNKVSNNGNIEISGNNGIFVGIQTESGEVTNSGTITVNSDIKPDNYTEDIDFETYAKDYSYGIKTNGKVINEIGGEINISGTAIGMTGKDVTNNGTINITGIDAETDDGVKTPAGIFVSGKDSKATNNGNITGEKNFTVGMFAYDGATVINGEKGNITTDRGFDGYNGHIINYGTVETTDHAAEISGGTLTNYGTMSSKGEEVIFINEIGTVINEKGGVIKISGDYVAGINAYIDEEDVQKGEIISGTKIINNGLIEVTSQNLESNPNEFGENHSTGIYLGTNDGTASVTNNGNITMNGYKSVGIFAYNGKIENNNGGKISITGDMGTGLYISGDGSALNSGEITVNGTNSCGIYSHVEEAKTTEEELNPELFPTNKGIINITGENSYGMVAQTINRENKDLIGAAVLNGNESFKNAVINVTGNNSIGMYGSTADILNYGKINVTGENSVGMKTNGLAFADNYGTIAVTGNNSIGMSAENGGRVTNEKGGIINVKGNGSYAMKADGVNSWAVNEEGATINVGTTAGGAMWATNSGKITNDGTINLEKREGLTEDNKNGFAMIADGNSTIENNGDVFIKDALNITTDSTSAYIIGTNKDGSYGKVSAETVTVDGNVKVSAEMAKEGYKDSYALNNAIAGKTELGKNYKLSSTSLLYNAVSKTDEEGNLDVELVRNDTDISDLTSKEVSKVAGIFDRAMKDKTLSEKEKEILEKVFDSTSSAKAVDDTIKEFTGYNVYSNIARQIFDTKDMFVSYDKSIIDSLGDYSFNFNFIGNYADVNSKNGTAGYDSKVTGINGAVKFTDSLYGVIGYGYNDIDYDGSSDGTIETIHTGIYKDIKSQFGDIRTGIFGEYNFHETDRKVSGEKADSDFNSYLVGANVEISRKFGDDLYIKPALSFDLSYGKYEDFKEDGGADVKFEKQDYVSAVPAIELKLGKEFETSEIYGAVKYSYELGDLNKEQEIELFEYREDFQADNIEDAQTDVKFGASFNIKNISVNAELGKEFGKRDREYVKASFSYIF